MNNLIVSLTALLTAIILSGCASQPTHRANSGSVVGQKACIYYADGHKTCGTITFVGEDGVSVDDERVTYDELKTAALAIGPRQ